jgi:DNA-binding MarR family transcriptional regulator
MAATGLADTNMLTSGAMTNRIDRLESKGLVRRLKDPNDRRRVLVQLTGKGLKLIDGATDARFEAALKALDGLDDEQTKSLSGLLRLVLTTQDQQPQ